MLMNTSETRLTLMTLVARHLSKCPDAREDETCLVDTLSPAGLSDRKDQQSDLRKSLNAARELGLVTKSGEEVALSSEATEAISRGDVEFTRHVRGRVLSNDVNKGKEWGKQTGARDLTNSLSWFLTLPAGKAPRSMEGTEPSVKSLQEEDFGNRHDTDDDTSNWPISGETNFQAFRLWSCSLGFAWCDPTGRILPDPTPAIRDALPEIFETGHELTAKEFIVALGKALPVLEGGAYRKFMKKNWERKEDNPNQLTQATTEALRRIENEDKLKIEKRDDAVGGVEHFCDSAPFSHVTWMQQQ